MSKKKGKARPEFVAAQKARFKAAKKSQSHSAHERKKARHLEHAANKLQGGLFTNRRNRN